MGRKSKKYSGVDPLYLEKERMALRRDCRKSVLFNSREISAIDEYCRRFKIKSKSALIRKAVMEQVLKELDENHPTLFE